MIAPRLAKDAIQAALEFQRQRIWTQISDAEVIGVRFPGEPHPLFVCVLGNAGREFGIACYRGAQALAQLRSIFASSDIETTVLCDILTMTFDAPGSVPPELRTLAAAAGVSDRIIPLFLIRQPGRSMREARTPELRLLTSLTRALLLAHSRGLLRPLEFDAATKNRLLMLTVRDEGKALDVAARYVTLSSTGAESAPTVEAPPELAGLDRFEGVAPILEPLGTKCSLASDSQLLAGVVARMTERFAARDPDAVPAPDDHLGWKRAMEALDDRIDEHRDARGMSTIRPREAYFGEPCSEEDLEEMGIAFAELAFREWFLVHWRAAKGRATLAERLLAQTLPEPQRLLLQARVDGQLGIYRVESVREPLVEFADILSKHRITVRDSRLARSFQVGVCVPGRACEAAGFAFFMPLGPPLGVGVLDSALQFLEEEGFSPTTEGIRTEPEQFGLLWLWLLEENEQPVTLVNTDGDPLLLQTATFAVGDASTLRTALGARADVDADEGADQWVWFRPKSEERTLLARLELIDDQLLVEVNSAKRLANVRAWLEVIPGVTFLRTRIHELGASGPLDNQLGSPPASLPDEALAELQQFLDRKYLGWLDESIPVLGGKTPRQAIATPEGRAKVVRLIKTIPDPAGTPGLRAPRENLLRELGLEGA